VVLAKLRSLKEGLAKDLRHDRVQLPPRKEVEGFQTFNVWLMFLSLQRGYATCYGSIRSPGAGTVIWARPINLAHVLLVIFFL
jgi:hypothetical protein